jgi:hypothetical protein
MFQCLQPVFDKQDLISGMLQWVEKSIRTTAILLLKWLCY